MKPTTAVAAIDCGTNTTRLLIAGPLGTIRRDAIITGLGRGLRPDGPLAEEAMAKVIDALDSFSGALSDHQVSRCRVVATSAARDASNGQEFLARVADAIGHEPEIIAGVEEAALGFAGATSGLAHEGSVLVVDIGGGSTEFSFGRVVDGVAEFVGATSVDMGSVRFTEAYVEHDPPRPEELSGMLQVIEAHMDDVSRDLPEAGGASLVIAVAGTATTVAAVEIGMIDYDPDVIDGFILERDAVEDVFRTLATEAFDDRIHNPGLQAERGDVIVAGAAILAGVLRHFGLDQVMVREADLLDGLVESIA